MIDPLLDAAMDADPPMRFGVAPGGFRLPDDLALGAVVLQVSDLTRSLSYYQSVLGLAVMSRDAETATLGSGVAPRHDALVILRERKGAAAVAEHSRLGLYHFAILLPDRASLGRFLAHLSDIGIRAGAADHLVSEALYLRDPDGLGIEVYADRPRSQWQAVAGELRMASDPLDFESVIAAGAGQPWAGMPTGTRMGHLHLHVGDLELASRFYHDACGLARMVWSYRGALFLAAGGYHHHLGLNIWAGRNAPPAGDNDARLIEWRAEVNAAQLGELARSLTLHGFAATPDENDLIVVDPWGTRLRVTGGS